MAVGNVAGNTGIGILLACITVTGIAIFQNSPHSATPAQSVAQQEGEQAFKQARELVRAQLRDPDSAEFWGRYWLERVDGAPAYVCGKVNAKNGFGGYSGYQYYMAAVGELHKGEVIIGPSPQIAKSWCGAATDDDE